MPYLEIKLGPDTLLLRFVGRIDYVFGRLPKADVQLRDMKVSRLHTQFFIDSRGGAFVRDLGSSGGTYIGQQRLRRGVIAPLTDQTKIKIGDARITFYDAEPPVNAVSPPARSDPRGLVRTNPRERFFEAEATVLAVDKVDPETQSGPAEAPPEVNPADFTEDGTSPPPKPEPKRPPKKRKPDTGIVEAPWEKKGAQPLHRDEVVSLQGGRKPTGKIPPKMQSVEYDETGQLKGADVPPPQAPAPQAPPPPPPPPPAPEPVAEAAPAPDPQPSEAPAEELGDIADTGDLDELADELDETGRTARSNAVDDGSGAFQPPPPIAGELPAEDEAQEPPRLGMPTVRLEKPAVIERQKQEEEAEEKQAPRIPTTKIDKEELEERRRAAEAEEEQAPPPKIGLSEEEEKAKPKPGYEDDLTDTQIAEFLGGSASGRFGDVDFGGGEGVEKEEEAEGEVEFGAAAANIDEAADIDIEEEVEEAIEEEAPEPAEAPEEEPAQEAEEEETAEAEVQEADTQMAGNTTAIAEDPAEEEAPEDEPAAEKAEAESPAEDAPAEEAAEPVEDVPSFDQKKTPPPTTRQGATSDRTFKPRKTRKLMKRKTGKITDKKHPTPPPSGEKTRPLNEAAVPRGDDTMYIPKPEGAKLSRSAEDSATGKIDEDAKANDDKPTGKAQKVEENLGGKKVEDLGHGPGGDTVALPPAMMKKLQEELKGKKKEEEKPATIGENPTVKKTDDEDDEEEEFVLDEDYAFFTPPPPTRKAREQQKEDDVIDANDFAAESEALPENKKSGLKKRSDDTIVE